MAKRRKGDSTNWIKNLHEGGLHESTHTPLGKKISASKLSAAKAGRYGKRAKKQAAAAKTLAKLRKRRR